MLKYLAMENSLDHQYLSLRALRLCERFHLHASLIFVSWVLILLLFVGCSSSPTPDQSSSSTEEAPPPPPEDDLLLRLSAEMTTDTSRASRDRNAIIDHAIEELVNIYPTNSGMLLEEPFSLLIGWLVLSQKR